MNDRLASLIGLCLRARRCALGEQAGAKAIQSGAARAILICAGAGPNTRDRFERLSKHYGVSLAVVEPTGLIENATGRHNLKVFVVTDEGISGEMSKMLAYRTSGVQTLHVKSQDQ